MRSLPLFRFNSRARSTSLGIALCTMFLVASFSVVSGLRTSMDNLAGNFESELSLVTLPEDGALSLFSPEDLVGLANRTAHGIMVGEAATPSDQRVTVFCVDDPNDVLDEPAPPTGSQALAGMSLDLSDNVTLAAAGSVEVTISGKFSSAMFSSSWLYSSPETAAELAGAAPGEANFAMVSQLTSAERSSLESGGFVVQGMVGILEFLDSGIGEIESDALWVLVPSAFVIAVLAYSYIGSEIADRRHDIGIIKTLGARRMRVLGYLLAEAAVICSWGGLFGLALGIVLSYGISTLASVMFTSVFMIEMNETLLLMSFLATVSAGVLGAVIPALRMTMTSPVKDLKEVTPSS